MFREMTVSNWMHAPVVTVAPEQSVAAAAVEMTANSIGAVAVIGRSGLLIGILSERDLLRAWNLPVEQQTVRTLMTPEPLTVSPDTPVRQACVTMKVNRIRHLPVVHGERLVGMVSQRDLLYQYQFFLEENTRFLEKKLVTLQQLCEIHEEQRLPHLMDRMEELERETVRDYLTGLYNARYLRERLEEEVSRTRRNGLQLSVVFADIDHFKQINDQYGHETGNRILRGLSLLLVSKVDEWQGVSHLRRTDVVARYGGEEFVILLPDTNKYGALVAAERLREIVAGTNLGNGYDPLTVTMSFGIASMPEDCSDGGHLIELADTAMYRAKQEGRNRVCIYDSDQRKVDAAAGVAD